MGQPEGQHGWVGSGTGCVRSCRALCLIPRHFNLHTQPHAPHQLRCQPRQPPSLGGRLVAVEVEEVYRAGARQHIRRRHHAQQQARQHKRDLCSAVGAAARVCGITGEATGRTLQAAAA